MSTLGPLPLRYTSIPMTRRARCFLSLDTPKDSLSLQLNVFVVDFCIRCEENPSLQVEPNGRLPFGPQLLKISSVSVVGQKCRHDYSRPSRTLFVYPYSHAKKCLIICAQKLEALRPYTWTSDLVWTNFCLRLRGHRWRGLEVHVTDKVLNPCPFLESSPATPEQSRMSLTRHIRDYLRRTSCQE
ncbi:hypothetical protein KCU62_g83, partial [Aureobasidium sp. EXF-3399]